MMTDKTNSDQLSRIQVQPKELGKVDEDKWVEATRGHHKKRLYGAGELAPCYRKTSSDRNIRRSHYDKGGHHKGILYRAGELPSCYRTTSSYRSTGRSHYDENNLYQKLLDEKKKLRIEIQQMAREQEQFAQKMATMQQVWNDMNNSMMVMMQQQTKMLPLFLFHPNQSQIPVVIPSQPQDQHGLTLYDYNFGASQLVVPQPSPHLLCPKPSPSDMPRTPSQGAPFDHSLSTPK